MITRLSHVTVYVLDQEDAKKFYTEKLGFAIRTDVTMDGFRWLTVGPQAQPELEIVLMEAKASPMMDADTAAQLRQFVTKGLLGAGVFETEDCRATYQALKAKGVEFLSPPAERPYGIEAVLKDNSGNWFSMTQHHG